MGAAFSYPQTKNGNEKRFFIHKTNAPPNNLISPLVCSEVYVRPTLNFVFFIRFIRLITSVIFNLSYIVFCCLF